MRAQQFESRCDRLLVSVPLARFRLGAFGAAGDEQRIRLYNSDVTRLSSVIRMHYVECPSSVHQSPPRYSSASFPPSAILRTLAQSLEVRRSEMEESSITTAALRDKDDALHSLLELGESELTTCALGARASSPRDDRQAPTLASSCSNSVTLQRQQQHTSITTLRAPPHPHHSHRLLEPLRSSRSHLSSRKCARSPAGRL